MAACKGLAINETTFCYSSSAGQFKESAADAAESHFLEGSSAHTCGGCGCAGEQRCAVGTLLACGRVHHHLVRTQMRSRVGLLLESAEAREVDFLSRNAILSDG